MTLTDELRKELSKQKPTLYAIGKESGVAWATLKRFLEGSSIHSGQLDKLAIYLGAKVTFPPVKKASKPARKRQSR